MSGTTFADVATFVVRRSPWSEAERRRFVEIVGLRGFRAVWPSATDPMDVRRALRSDPGLAREARVDLVAPTDDRPFFFEIRPLFLSWWWALADRDLRVISMGSMSAGLLLGLYVLSGWLLVVEPLRRLNRSLEPGRRVEISAHVGPVVYFAMIGLGFLMVEIAVLQRYFTFLGHPTYALSVVLFSLLLSSGLGSSLSPRVADPRVPLGLILVFGLATAFGVPPLLEALQGMGLWGRFAVGAALVAPLGLCMGMMFPLGVRKLREEGLVELVPWLWCVNGIAGVMASAGGILLAMSQGYTVTLLVGCGCYVVVGFAAMRSWGVKAAAV